MLRLMHARHIKLFPEYFGSGYIIILAALNSTVNILRSLATANRGLISNTKKYYSNKLYTLCLQ